jgi:hypothetical protein
MASIQARVVANFIVVILPAGREIGVRRMPDGGEPRAFDYNPAPRLRAIGKLIALWRQLLI